ncbi:MAG TPA: hypothetical protein VFM55_03030 [Micromonosporaceae bacterium]|nr:hypothetical protein [Micromonosporaceae bacterium]
MSPGRHDVHVGIVTALPVECAAVRLLVDDRLDERVDGDPNNYLTGRLPSRDGSREHRVVIAMQTQDGTRNAAAICTDLVRSFPALRCVVMCGIAGGVPAPAAPERHVRLGDIVVATEGVVDYDHVRTVDGRSDLRRTVEGVSLDLLRADRELQVKERAGDWPWRAWLDGTGKPPGFARPPDSTDVLLRRGERINHPRRSRSGHLAGWPRVHRCAIASADRLVRDAVMRDKMAERYEIRAVEMEASGVAVGAYLRGIGWFVIRGVADYCDASKNEVWHPYAALAAAAYVRALLAECPPFSGGPGSSMTAPAMGTAGHNHLRTLVEVLLAIPQMRDDYQRRAIMALLPDEIRTMVPDNVNGRLHVVAMVQTCIDMDGREGLLNALKVSLPSQSLDLRRVEETINSCWPSWPPARR